MKLFLLLDFGSDWVLVFEAVRDDDAGYANEADAKRDIKTRPCW